MPIDNIDQNLESAINKTYQEMDSENPVALISQIKVNGVCHSCLSQLLLLIITLFPRKQTSLPLQQALPQHEITTSSNTSRVL